MQHHTSHYEINLTLLVINIYHTFFNDLCGHEDKKKTKCIVVLLQF